MFHMKLHRITVFLFLTSFFFFSARSMVAQSPSDDSILYSKAVNHLIALYHQSSGDQSGLYNGSQHSGYPFSFEAGQPFFNNDKPGTGSVVYDGILYENVSLQYDEVQEALVMQDSTRRMRLLNDRIERFTLFNNNFIRIVKDTESTVLIRTGFYNLLYAGKTSMLKREEKIIREDPSTGVLLRFVDSHVYYYIKMNNSYLSIKSKKGLLNIFKDKKKDIRQYIRKNKLSYRKDRDNTLIKTTAYYDQLIK
jgi:hypothetical protein